MVCLGYAESENNPVIGTRQAGGSSHQRTLWSDFRQRSNPVCPAQGMARAIKATQTTCKGLASLPVTEVRDFTLGSESVYCNVSTPSPLGDGGYMEGERTKFGRVCRMHSRTV